MVENKILNVGRASLEIEVHALCLLPGARGFLLANVGGMSQTKANLNQNAVIVP